MGKVGDGLGKKITNKSRWSVLLGKILFHYSFIILLLK